MFCKTIYSYESKLLKFGYALYETGWRWPDFCAGLDFGLMTSELCDKQLQSFTKWSLTPAGLYSAKVAWFQNKKKFTVKHYNQKYQKKFFLMQQAQSDNLNT